MNTYYPSGALYSSITSDRVEYFYEDGILKTVEPYREGRLHGEAILYWPNGTVKRRCQFVNGARSGWDRMWDERGELLDEELYG